MSAQRVSVLALLLATVLLSAPGPGAGAGEAEPPAAKIARLVKDLGADDFEARERATRELRELGAAAREALEAAAKSPDAEVRDRAELLLREIRWGLPKELAARLGAFAARFGTYLDATEDRRLELLAGLRRRAPAEARRYILQAIQESPRPEARGWLSSLLAIYRDREAEDAVLEAARSTEPSCRLAAAGALRSFPGEKVLARLKALAADADPVVRRSALDSIGERGPEARAALAAVSGALADADGQVRAAAARALARLGDRGSLEAIWKLTGGTSTDPMASRQELSIRLPAIGAAGELAPPGDAAAVKRLTGLLDDPLPAVRSEALRALVSMRATAAAARLAGLLSDGDPSLAAEAARALGALGGPGQFEALRRTAAESRDESLVTECLLASVELGDAGAPARAAELLTKRGAGAAESMVRALGLTGDLAWAGKLAAAEEHWQAEAFTAASLEVRDRALRDPGALLPRAKLLAGQSAAEWAYFLDDHALFAESIELVERQLGARLDEPGAASALGVALCQAGREEQGIARLRQAAEMAPFSAGALNNLAWLLLTAYRPGARDAAEALKLAERAAGLAPRSGYILDTHAWALFANGKKPEALERIDEALRWARTEEGSERVILEAHRARILAGLGREPEARESLAAALRRRPRDPRLAVEAARAFCQMRDPASARAQIERMIELSYPDVETIRNDPELDLLRKADGFKALAERAAEARSKLKESLPAARPAALPAPDDEDLPGGVGEGAPE